MNLRIGIVARCLNTAHIRGMGRYVYELIQQLVDEPGVQWLVLGDDPRHPLNTPTGMRGAVEVFPFRGDRFQLWEQVGLPRRVKQQQVSVLHCTEGTLPLWQPVPTVVTLHDTLAWQELQGGPAVQAYFRGVLPAALKRCAAIITGSASARDDISAKWPVLADKITVIPHGIGSEYLKADQPPVPSELQRSLSHTPYLVYLGGPLERKRFGWAVQALLASGLPQMQLVACGFGPAAAAAARAALPANAAERVHFAPFLSNEEIFALYRTAVAVLYPTLYEGFGFPAIEAQAAGVPVIFSPVSSLNELVGPLTLLAAPHDINAWAGAIQRAATMGAERTALADEARDWVQAFSWHRSALAHLEVYRRIAKATDKTR